MTKVTPAGVVSTFASGFDGPDGLAFDAAGNLYVADAGDNTVVKVSQDVAVPFTLGGTAVSGVALQRRHGQSADVRDRADHREHHRHAPLRPRPHPDADVHPGHAHGGATLGNPSTNTLTITEPASVQFSTGSETDQRGAGTFSIPGDALGHSRRTPPSPPSPPGSTLPTAWPSTPPATSTSPTTGDGTVSKVTPAGTVTTFASGFNDPVGLAFDAAGNLYVANCRQRTRCSKVTPAGEVSTFASGFDDPVGLAFDAAGNLYVANLEQQHGERGDARGAGVSTFATGLNDPDGLAFDAAGNLYVANAGNNTVSEVTPAGAVTTFASGFNDPDGLAFDAAGNLYVANGGNNTVSEVTPAGVVSTFASGFDDPAGLAFGSGNLYVAERRQQHGEPGHRNRDRAVHARRHRGLGRRLQRRHGQSADVRDRADTPRTSPARSSPTPAPARR